MKSINIEEYIREHQGEFFGSNGATPEAISSSIARGVLLLGATKVLIEKHNDCHFVCANLDWLAASFFDGVNEENIFDNIWSFPQEGINCHRSEIMARVFSSNMYTYKSSELTTKFGKAVETLELSENMKQFGSWKRTIAFKFKK